MLRVKCLAAFVALCVTRPCVASGEGYSFQHDMSSTMNQTHDHLVLTPTFPKTLHPEKVSFVTASGVDVTIRIETPRPETLAVDDVVGYVPTPTKQPCPPLPAPTFWTEPDTEALTKETALEDDLEYPSPVVTLVIETHPPFETAPYTPTSVLTEPYSELSAAKALQHEEATEAYPGHAPTAPCPTLVMASETEALQTEKTTEAYPGHAPTAPCPTLVMASETEAPQTEKTTETYSTPTIPCPTFTLLPKTEAN